VVAFALWTLVARARLPRAPWGERARLAGGFLRLGAFYVVLNALPDARARPGASRAVLLIAVAIVALLSMVQVGLLPAPGVRSSRARPWFGC